MRMTSFSTAVFYDFVILLAFERYTRIVKCV